MNTFKILLAGNPNVGKSTVFNALTGLKQHTGNWSGKTVELASGNFRFQDSMIQILDLPGTYSLISNSPEEEIAGEALCFQSYDLVLVVVDATCLTRNLNLLLQIADITPHMALCVNLLDEARRRNTTIDLPRLESLLQIPVIGISAHKRKDIRRLKNFLGTHIHATNPHLSSMSSIQYPEPFQQALTMIEEVIPETHHGNKRYFALRLLDDETYLTSMKSAALSTSSIEKIQDALNESKNYLARHGITAIDIRDTIVSSFHQRSLKITESCVHTIEDSHPKPGLADKLITSRWLGFPLMLLLGAVLFWITIVGANIPSNYLMSLFQWIEPYLYQFLCSLSIPLPLCSLIMDGIYQTATWVTAVMLPPMMIFFPFFTLLEDIGFLPRLAFNLDRCFKKSGSCGKQALTMCMGLGCNAVGVTGCRIISDKRQRLVAMITNCFIPCNGRFSLLINLSTLFIGTVYCQKMQSAVAVIFIFFLLLCSISFTLLITALLTKWCSKEFEPSFSMELPPYRKPRISQILIRSLLDRTFKILWRSLRISMPAGALLWIFSNISVNNYNLLSILATFLDPFGKLLGMDGMILMAFLLALPANEIFLPVLLMGYLSYETMYEPTNLLAIKTLLLSHGWSTLTAVNVMLFSVLHFPCATTLFTIKKESHSILWTFLGFIIPTTVAIGACLLTTCGWKLFNFFF